MTRGHFPLTVAAAAMAVAAQFPAGAEAASPAEAAVHTPPARVERIEGGLKRITLTEKAAKRIDLQTAEVVKDPSGELVVPYASLFYDVSGKPWVYISPAPLSFVRQPVAIARINGERAYLKEGPPPGTRVVTVGVAQLWGVDKGIGH